MHVVSRRNFRKTTLSWLVAIALLPLAACSQSKSSGPFDLALTKFTLANGMKVVLHEDHRVPKVKVVYRVNVGSADEPAGRAGFAHLFEHLMFMGTKAAPNFDRVMERVGGENNAYTDLDETVYYETAPSNALPTLLWLEADRLANLPAYMTDVKVGKQRDVVLNEMRQSVLDEPGGAAAEAVGFGLFDRDHPYYRPVIGSIADLEAATTKDVVDFFAKYYAPANITMVIAGDFESARTKATVKRLFEQIKKRDVPKTPVAKACRTATGTNTKTTVRTRSTKKAPKEKAPSAKATTGASCRGRDNQRQIYVDAVANPQVTLTWSIPPQRFGGSIANPDLELAAAMMGNVYANSLQKTLVRESKIATSISVSYDSKERASFFDITGEAAPGVTPEALEKAIQKELRALIKNGFAESELETVKTNHETSFAEQFEDVYGRADLLQGALTRYGNVDRVANLRNRFQKTTTESARRALEKAVNGPMLTQFVTPGDRGDFPNVLRESTGTPAKTKTVTVAPVEILRPRNTPQQTVKVPTPDTYRLANGITLHYFERTDAPRTRLLLRVRGGSVRDPKPKLGRATFLSYTIMRGVGSRDAEQLTRDLAKYGAGISVDTDDGLYRVGLNVNPSQTKEGLAILADVLQRPRFDQKELDLSKAEIVSYFEAAATDPGENASRAGIAFYADNDHRKLYGTLATYKGLTRADLLGEHKAVFQPQNTEMIAAGPLPGKELVTLLNTALKGWKNSGPPMPKYVEIVPAASPIRTVLVDVPNAAQSTIVFKGTGPGSKTPNGLNASVAALVLGGTFSSRLNASLREEKGYTYGISGSLDRGQMYGTFESVTSVETSVTGKALDELQRVVTDFQTGNVDQRETDVATSAAYASSIDLVSTSSALVGTFDARLGTNRPWNELGRDLTKAGSLTVDELNKGAKIVMDGQSTLIVIAGDLAKVKPQLKGLNTGPITEVKPVF